MILRRKAKALLYYFFWSYIVVCYILDCNYKTDLFAIEEDLSRTLRSEVV